MDVVANPAVDWQSTLQRADGLASAGDHQAAEPLYRTVAEHAPQTVSAYLGGARCARRRGDRAASLAWLDAALSVDGRLIAVHLERAADLQALHRDEDEAAAYQAVIDLAPDNIQAHLGLGKNARRRGDRTACMTHFQTAARLAPCNPWPRLDIADECRELGHLDRAEDAYRQVLGLAPNTVQAYRGLGHCARRRGDHQTALGHFQAAVALTPADPGPRLEVADALRDLGRLEAAEDAYRDVLHLAADNIPAVRGLAHCAHRRGDRQQALSHAIHLARLAPAEPTMQLSVAEELRALGRLDEAEAAYRAILAASPNHIPARLGMGKCARGRGEPEAALQHFKAAVASAPDQVGPWIDIGDQCRELGRFDQAEDAYHAALLLDRGRLQAWLGLGHCARQRGTRRQSLAHFHAAILAAPASIAAHLEAALDLRELGLLQGAEQVYRQALSLEPGNQQAQLGLGLCARRRGRRQESLAAFRAAAAANPEQPAAQLEVATDLRELGDLEGAAAICRAVAASRPDYADAHLGLGYCARAQGDRPAAQQHFRQATIANANHVGAWLELAFEQREQGDTEAAIDTARGVLQRHPGNLQAMLSIGLSERQNGRHEAALEWFQRASLAYPAQAAPLLEMALEERSLGNQARADDLIAQALVLEPRNVTAITRRAEHAMLAFDAQTAYEVYLAASEDQPGQTALRLGLADALAALGRVDEALACLVALEAEQGSLPAILHKRLHLLRRDGDYRAALALAREATPRWPHHFALWAERLHAELLVGTEPEVECWLAAAPAGSIGEQASLHRCHGFLAERRWQLARAASHYEEAAAILPDDAGVQHDLLRVKVLLLDIEAAQTALRRFCRLTAHMTRLQNKSLNVSQTHFGQIIDEYRLDEAVPQASEIMRSQSPRERLRWFRGAAQLHPDSTAMAVGLLVALRQSGALARRAPGRPGLIPKRVAQFWDTAPPPDDVARLMRTWPALNPDYAVALFNDSSAQIFLADHFPSEVLRAYRHVREPAQKADIFRLAWLVIEGGVYADADDRCIAPLGTIIPAHAELLLFQEELGTVANDFIAARPAHPLLLSALRRAVDAVNRGDSDIVWLSTGPGLLTRALAQWLPDDTVPDGMIVLDRHELFQAVAPGCMTGYKKTTRHWSNSSFAARHVAAGKQGPSPQTSLPDLILRSTNRSAAHRLPDQVRQ